MVRSPKQSPARWEPTPLPGPWLHGSYPLGFPETAVLAAGDRIDAIVRNDAGPAQTFHSTDGGQTWHSAGSAQMPIARRRCTAAPCPTAAST